MSPISTLTNQPHSGQTMHAKPKEHLTAMSVFLSFLLTVTLIGLGQRGIYDLNRLYNPEYQVCNQAEYLLSVGKSCAIEKYAFQTVLFHSYVSFPLFLIFLSLMLYLRHHRLNTWQKAMFRVSSAVAIFFGLEFLIEVTIYLFRFYRIAAWYFFLTILALLLVWLLIYNERRSSKKKAAGQAHH